jgi:predicted Zn-dependent protease
VDAWLKLAELERRLCGWGTGKGEVDVYKNELKSNTTNKLLYSKYIQAVKWHSQEKRAIPVLKMLINERPNRSEFYSDLAEIYLIIENTQSSLLLLDSLEKKFPDYSESQLNLLRAKNYFHQQDSQQGLSSSSSVSLSNKYFGTDRDEKIYINFDPGDKRAGKYELLIRVTDLVANQDIEKTVSLKIL